MEKLINAGKWILLIFLYILLLSCASEIIRHISFCKDLFRIISLIIISTIFILIYRKDYTKEKFIQLKDNKVIKDCFKIWLLGLAFMIVTNIIISYYVGNIAGNETANRTVINTHFIYAILSMIIISPIIEEILFRLSIRKFIDNKYLYFIFSSIIFGYVHVIGSVGLDVLYIIPYTSLGLAFSYIHYKHDNILCSTLMHIIHNLICIIIITLL